MKDCTLKEKVGGRTVSVHANAGPVNTKAAAKALARLLTGGDYDGYIRAANEEAAITRNDTQEVNPHD